MFLLVTSQLGTVEQIECYYTVVDGVNCIYTVTLPVIMVNN